MGMGHGRLGGRILHYGLRVQARLRQPCIGSERPDLLHHRPVACSTRRSMTLYLDSCLAMDL